MLDGANKSKWTFIRLGGILVRTGRELFSEQVPERLATGAIVREEALIGDRLEFRRLIGEGPDRGWVSIKLKDKELLRRTKKPLVQAGNAPSVEGNPARKVRVLCLHGTASAAEVLKMQLSMLLRKSKDDIEFIILEGHIECDESNPLVGRQLKIMKNVFPKTTFKQYAEPEGGTMAWRTYTGLDDALSRIQDALRSHAPVDALYGFSQGGNLAHLIAAQASVGQGAPLRCVVHCCPNLPGWMEQKPELFSKPLTVPALVIKAEQDTVSVGSAEVAATYTLAETASHSDEHRPFPADKEEAAALVERIREFMLKHCLTSDS